MNEVQTIVNRATVLDISINNLGRLAGISSGEIAARLNGRKPLTSELYKRLLDLTDALLDLKVSSNLPIEWSDIDFIQGALKERETVKELTLQIMEDAL